MSIDETMSQDQAFSTDSGSSDTFTFDAEPVTPASPAETTPEIENKENNSDASASPVGTEEEEQKVPYSRFKKKVDELNETTSKIQLLEERLQQLESQPQESTEEVTPDAEWIALYGDSDVAKKAYQVQQRREQLIEQRAIERTIEVLSQREEEQASQLTENEEIIEQNLESLQETIGRKLTAKQEEDILTIVDEFSPVGDDGKYVTLFPFDKAYEIYQLRNSKNGNATRKARETVADLTGTSSQGESDSTSSPLKPGWDGWRSELE